MLEPPLHPYEAQRLKQCMRNSARLQQLGIPDLVCTLANTSSTTTNKNKTNHRSSEASDNEYDPSHDDTGEEDLFDDDSAKGSKDPKKTYKNSNKRTIHMPPGGIRPQSKRVFAEQQTTRTTRLKTSIAQSNSSDIGVPPQDTHANVQADGLDQLDGNTHMANGGDAIARTDGHNHMANEDDGLVQLDGGMANGAEGITQHGGDIHMANEGGRKERRERGPNMGHGLQRMNRARRGKLPVLIPEGKIRPVVPLIAAKFATECNIIVRNHVPVLKHWKDYKNQPGLFKLFIGKLSAKFDIDTSDATVQKACSEMMKAAIRQQRYRLKKQHFDPFPLHLVPKTSPVKSMTNEQWIDLVESWTSPKKMETCEKNKENRGLVKFHQTTGSCSYMVLVENLGDKYIDEEPDALNLFKECHYSKKKKSYTSAVQLAITEMENKMSTPTEGEQSNSVTQVVADVLAENTKKNQFLHNVGIQNNRPRSSAQDIEAQLEAEKRANDQLSRQVEVLSKQVQETEQARIKDQEEMKKKHADMEAKLELLLSQMQPP